MVLGLDMVFLGRKQQKKNKARTKAMESVASRLSTAPGTSVLSPRGGDFGGVDCLAVALYPICGNQVCTKRVDLTWLLSANCCLFRSCLYVDGGECIAIT